MGRVRSWRSGNGRGPAPGQPRLLRPFAASGYPRVAIGGRHVCVHALVLEAFAGPRSPGQVARHLNDERFDNRVQNLRWGTPAENRADALRNGRRLWGLGEEICHAILTEARVREIRAWKTYGFGRREIAAWYGVKPATVSHVWAGRSWRHVN